MTKLWPRTIAAAIRSSVVIDCFVDELRLVGCCRSGKAWRQDDARPVAGARAPLRLPAGETRSRPKQPAAAHDAGNGCRRRTPPPLAGAALAADDQLAAAQPTKMPSGASRIVTD
jgi:hypothetical protein